MGIIGSLSQDDLPPECNLDPSGDEGFQGIVESLKEH